MNGQPSILANFLKFNDPVPLLKQIADIIQSYNKQSWNLIDSIRRWWIVKWKYPFFKAKVDGMEKDTADHLFNHPSLLVFVVTRYLVYLSQYCTAFGIKIEQFLDATFPPGAHALAGEPDRGAPRRSCRPRPARSLGRTRALRNRLEQGGGTLEAGVAA